MIRSILRHLTAPALGLLAPEILTSIRRAELSAARAQGRGDELRDMLDARHGAINEAHDRVTELEHEVETLRSELASASPSRDDEAGALDATDIDLGRAEIRVGQIERERDELQRRLDARGEKANEDGALILALGQSEVNAAREIGSLQRANSELETQRDAHRSALVTMTTERNAAIAHADVMQEQRDFARNHLAGYREAGKETQEDLDAARARILDLEARVAACEWCGGLGGRMGCRIEECGVDVASLCNSCTYDVAITAKMIGARAAARAASCPSRRTSADPLAIDCPTCKRKAAFDCHPAHVDLDG